MKVAILGFGTVGVGVFDMLNNSPQLEAGPVLVRPGKEDQPFKVSSIDRILSDSSVEAVAEVMGGVEPAFTYVSAALRAGKHVVTSNKALVAAKGTELAAIAKEHRVGFLFSAACGGAVPILHNLALAAESDRIISIGGILNGTTNYMLDLMQSGPKTYDEALKEAQQLGYAEADPTADVSGADALRKIMLACGVAYGLLPTDGLNYEGITSITANDVKHFQKISKTCRLIASGSMGAGGDVCAYVQPVLFDSSAPECSVFRNFNMAKYLGENSGSIVMIGQGAGRYPTASAVVRDLSDITHGRREMLRPGCIIAKADNSSAKHNYYVRCEKCDVVHFKMQQLYSDRVHARLLTARMPVTEMFRIADQIRKEGRDIFFAAVEN